MKNGCFPGELGIDDNGGFKMTCVDNFQKKIAFT